MYSASIAMDMLRRTMQEMSTLAVGPNLRGDDQRGS
jgi:hypothetical protein